MALDNFKNIIDRKGYLVEQEDRKIFEKEISKSNFGLGYSDMIEFILYDSNDNQLPQGEEGNLVRYIDINDSNINDYFIISDNKLTKKMNGASEFIIDIEKLIREAGYSSGIFKTQVTLLNRRAGTESVDNDKLWIHEISPSRTEVRLLPVKGKPNPDLQKRYDIFINDGNFRDDTIYYAIPFIENINIQTVLERLLLSKGNERRGKKYLNLIRSEFKVDSIDLMINRIKDKYIESMQNFIKGKDWNINSVRYGKDLNRVDVIELSKSTIEITALQALTNAIEKYLPKRDIREETGLTKEEQVTLDEVKQILKSASSNTTFKSDIPSTIDSVVRGCMDKNAMNYNPKAKEDDGSCKYKTQDIDSIEQEDPKPIRGCTDKSAINFNPKAEEDDGSCQYKDKPAYKTQTYYVWSERAKIEYKDRNGTLKRIDGREYDSYKIQYQVGTYRSKGDVRTVPKIRIPEPTKPKVYSFTIQNISRKTRKVFRPKPIGNIGFKGRRGGAFPFLPELDIFAGQPLSVSYKDKNGTRKQSSSVAPGSSITICAEEGSISNVPGLKITRAGACTTAPPNPKPRPIIRPIFVPRPEPTPRPIPIPIRSNPTPTITRSGGGGGRGSRAVFDEGPRPGRRSDDLYGGQIELRIGRDIR